jgi:hypothetical protein
MPSRAVLELKLVSLASEPHTTLITSLMQSDFGAELFGSRHLWPDVTDSPKTRQSPLSSVLVENLMTAHVF